MGKEDEIRSRALGDVVRSWWSQGRAGISMQWGVALGCSGLREVTGSEELLEGLSVECGLIYREGVWLGWGGAGQKKF